MIYTHAAAAIIAASLGAAGAWQIQDWRYGEKEAEHERQKLVEVERAGETAVRRLDAVLLAQSESVARAGRLRRDLDSSRAELERLRTAINSPLSGGEAAQATCPDRADTVGELLAACAAELVEVGERADRHASDVKTLTDAWPK